MSFDGAYHYAFINNRKMMFGAGDAIFEYDLAAASKKEVLNKIPDAAQQAIGFAKDGAAIFFRSGEKLLRIPLPPEKLTAGDVLNILTATK